MKKARRYDTDKPKYHLIPPNFLKELAKVYTIGAEKYTIRDNEGNVIESGEDNWRNGQPWKSTVASVIRHLEKFRDGEDFDYDWPEELLKKYGPTLHLGNAAWGIAALIEFYKIHPELDNRDHNYLNPKKIAIDIDEVIAKWTPAWCQRWDIQEPTSWCFDRKIISRFDEMRDNGELDQFYLDLEVLTPVSEIPFEPFAYVTSRPVSTEITEQWLDKNGFPHRPVHTVGLYNSKIDVLKEIGCDIFVDDRFENFVEINRAGICCYLFDAPHNQRYDVGYKRIKSLKELI